MAWNQWQENLCDVFRVALYLITRSGLIYSNQSWRTNSTCTLDSASIIWGPYKVRGSEACAACEADV